MSSLPQTAAHAIASGKPFLLRWRDAVASPAGPKATTRHVLLTLSLYMNLDGGSCFPTTLTLEEATGLSEKTVVTHLDRAEREGWIDKVDAGRSGRGWKRNGYEARLPERLGALKEVQYESPQRTEGGSVPQARRTEPEVRRTEPQGAGALKEVQSITPGITPKITSAPPDVLKEVQYHAETDADGEPRPEWAPELRDVLARGGMAGLSPEEAEAFFWHYEARGWTDGGEYPQRVQSWQALMMSWKIKRPKFDRHAQAEARRAADEPTGPVRDLTAEVL